MRLPNPIRAVVTGAGSGLGRAFCLELARRGGRVVVSDVNAEAAERTAEAVRAAGGEGHVVHCDVSRPEQVEALAARAEEQLGTVDLLINNAGVASAGEVGEVPLDDWHWIMGVNLWGVIHGCHYFLPRMKARRAGHVINVASAAGLLSVPTMAPYNVTKAGVVALSETLCGELANYGIGVTVLCPTFFQTDICKKGRILDERGRKQAEALMARAKLDAEGVARAALAAAEEGRLYALPMDDGRWMWRLKRLAPEHYHTHVTRALQRWVLSSRR